MKKLLFNPMQMMILGVLWERGHSTNQEIHELISERGRVPFTTVQSHLRYLEEKGAITHDIDGRTYVYRSLIDRDHVQSETLRDVIEQVFSGSAESMVHYLADNRFVSLEELEKVLDLLRRENKEFEQ